MLRFAANISWLFQEWDFGDRFTAAADAGFSAVECLFPYDHDPDVIARHLARHGLTMALINLPPGDLAAGEKGLAALPGRQGDFSAALDEALRHAGAYDVRRLHVMAGIGHGAAAVAAYRDGLALACDRAGARGITITIEPLNGHDAPGYLLNDFAMAEQIITAMARPNLKLQFDIYHRRILNGEVLNGLKTLMPVTGHIQIASVPGRHEPGGDDMAVLGAIARLGYDGFIGCEYRPRAGTREGLGWLADAYALTGSSGSTLSSMNR